MINNLTGAQNMLLFLKNQLIWRKTCLKYRFQLFLSRRIDHEIPSASIGSRLLRHLDVIDVCFSRNILFKQKPSSPRYHSFIDSHNQTKCIDILTKTQFLVGLRVVSILAQSRPLYQPCLNDNCPKELKHLFISGLFPLAIFRSFADIISFQTSLRITIRLIILSVTKCRQQLTRQMLLSFEVEVTPSMSL